MGTTTEEMSPEERLRGLARGVLPPDAAASETARRRHLRLTKPPGSLGGLEELGIRLAGMAGACPPPVPGRPAVLVAAGDHGVLGRGVSPWPQEVTAEMVRNFCRGGAAVNALAATVGARVLVLDVGVAAGTEPHPLLRKARVRPGTADLSRGAAMDRREAARAALAGAEAAEELVREGTDLLVTGDMGIGNTTPAACLVAAFTGRPAAEVTGRGTGIDDATLALKVRVVEEALALHGPNPEDPLGTLAAVGGLEHAALAGAILYCAARRVPVVLDGISSCAAALAAAALSPPSSGYMVAGHLSAEPGAAVALKALGLKPLLDLGMRLGEGTGGLLAVPLVRAAARVLSEMATFEEAGVSEG
ncbi:nicotinate-nucleotide--dimethylbenzimidazole phosphoribosyltransferase [Rubrobacter xylanophilus]|uniref:Nicotinate-nucleotide--dimethylbenzimidazole phosphoribosyltransferase n=1 Tax=Rubrobacter xylanophilus TaxID=49319 RepID=A0A510HMD3_9ACTN|nr:nicotinate-nucleotide--dimethylbenzimidazole phosphoribosyltransferase [Rubrobacter xylanophilus]BBL81142.1 nicotinate-nucleotide--dimethylbenzimidazole phosphoribosyltransferase [Rubrobacter xylanophilus]